jgi:hypothetical protein
LLGNSPCRLIASTFSRPVAWDERQRTMKNENEGKAYIIGLISIVNE